MVQVQAEFIMGLGKLLIKNVVTIGKFCHKQPEVDAFIVNQAREAAEVLSQRPTPQLTMRLPNPNPNPNPNPKLEQCK